MWINKDNMSVSVSSLFAKCMKRILKRVKNKISIMTFFREIAIIAFLWAIYKYILIFSQSSVVKNISSVQRLCSDLIALTKFFLYRVYVVCK